MKFWEITHWKSLGFNNKYGCCFLNDDIATGGQGKEWVLCTNTLGVSLYGWNRDLNEPVRITSEFAATEPGELAISSTLLAVPSTRPQTKEDAARLDHLLLVATVKPTSSSLLQGVDERNSNFQGNTGDPNVDKGQDEYVCHIRPYFFTIPKEKSQIMGNTVGDTRDELEMEEKKKEVDEEVLGAMCSSANFDAHNVNHTDCLSFVSAGQPVKLHFKPYGMYNHNNQVLICGSDGMIHTFDVVWNLEDGAVQLSEEPLSFENYFQDVASISSPVLAFDELHCEGSGGEGGSLLVTGDTLGNLSVRHLPCPPTLVAQGDRLPGKESGEDGTYGKEATYWVRTIALNEPITDVIILSLTETRPFPVVVVAGGGGGLWAVGIKLGGDRDEGPALSILSHIHERPCSGVLCLAEAGPAMALLGGLEARRGGSEEIFSEMDEGEGENVGEGSTVILAGMYNGTLAAIALLQLPEQHDQEGERHHQKWRFQPQSSMLLPYPIFSITIANLSGNSIVEDMVISTNKSTHILRMDLLEICCTAISRGKLLLEEESADNEG